MNSVYVWVLVFIAAIGISVGAAFLGRMIYTRQVRRSLVKLLGRREAIVAAETGVERVLGHLVDADDAALEAFAANHDSDDRHALDDVAARMRILADDLRSLPLPKRLWPVAESMEGTARRIAGQAGGVGDATSPDAALDALAAIRLADIRSDIEASNAGLEPLLDAYDVRDPAVYGGGMYI